MKAYILALVVATLVPSAFLHPAFAEGMRQPSSGASLDVLLDPQWGQDGEVQLRISFLQPGTDELQEHIDYDVVITNSEGNTVFRAAALLNQPILHTEPGAVTIPYKFDEIGSYTITIELLGILFVPITPETAEFPVNVVPEFSASALAAVAAAVGGVIAATKLKRL